MATTGYLLGIDIGTSGTKTLLCDADGKVCATASSEHTLLAPKPGWSEQDPTEWWAATCKATKAVLRKAKVKSDQVLAIGLSGQMHGSVFLADNDKPLRNALLWNDQRTQVECDEIEAAAGGRKKLIKMVGNPALTGFTAPKILWVRKHEPKIYAKTKKILLPKDYIRYCMTGEYMSEVSDASGTLLLDVAKRTWNKNLLSKLGIDADLMPGCVESHEITGTLHDAAAKQLGLIPGIPVVGGAGDNAAAAVGNGIVASGIAMSSLGTSGVMFSHSDTPALDPSGRVHTMCSAVAGKWCVFGCMLSAGGSLQWYRDQIAQEIAAQAKKQKRDAFDLLTQMAQSVPVGSESLFFLPYLTGERCPHPDPNARGSFIGLSLRHSQSHMVRSVMEGITFGMKDGLDIMLEMGIPVKKIRLTGGGGKSEFWRQLQADIYGKQTVTINSEEGPAYGVAILAGVGIGLWKNVPQACKAMIEETSNYKPTRKTHNRYQQFHGQYQDLYGALKEEFKKIAAL